MMVDEKKKHDAEPKERIFQTAIHLFSRKGFNAVGMRELAAEAGVNLAMINYFYGSKHGLLEAILDDFFQGVHEVMKANVFGEGTVEERLRRNLEAIIRHLGQCPQQALLAFTQLPLDDPHINDFKKKWVMLLFQTMLDGVVSDLEKSMGRPVPIHVIGPAIVGAAISHYLVKPILESLEVFVLDEAFYEELPRIISQIALYGTLSLKEHPEIGSRPRLRERVE